MDSAYIGPHRSGEGCGVIEARCTTSRLPKPPRHRALSQTSSPSASPLNHQPGQRQKMQIPSMLPLLSSPFCTFFSLLSSFFKGCATEGILGIPRCLWCSFEHIYHIVIVYKRRAPLALVLG